MVFVYLNIIKHRKGTVKKSIKENDILGSYKFFKMWLEFSQINISQE